MAYQNETNIIGIDNSNSTTSQSHSRNSLHSSGNEKTKKDNKYYLPAKLTSEEPLGKMSYGPNPAMEEQMKVLTNFVMNQARTFDEMKTLLTRFMQLRTSSAIGANGSHLIVTPSSKPPPTMDKEERDPKELKRPRKTARLSEKLSSKDKVDPTYTPSVTPPDSSDEQGFRHKRKKKGPLTKAIKPRKGPSKINPHIKEKLFSPADNRVDSISYLPRPLDPPFPGPPDLPVYMHGHDLPSWMSVAFRPAKDMRFFSVELAVAAYIFGSDNDPKKILVPNFHCNGDREAFMTITPGQPLVDDILIMVACMLTHGRLGHERFLPTTLTQIALGNNPMSDGTLDFIKTKFLGKVDDVLKIYAPIHQDNHWFLMVIDLLKMELVYLDSLKSDQHRQSRVEAMERVALFIEKLIQDDSFYDDPAPTRLAMSQYTVVEPVVPQQEDGSNDCGVWVVQWMMLSHLWNTYKFEKVNDCTRMRLAIDLALKDYNPYSKQLQKLAVESWIRKQQRYQ